MPRPRKTTTNSNIDFASLDAAFIGGQVLKLKSLSEQFNICIPVLRRLLAEHYGSGIQFVRGRTGGIRRVATSTNINPPAASSVEQETPTLVTAA